MKAQNKREGKTGKSCWTQKVLWAEKELLTVCKQSDLVPAKIPSLGQTTKYEKNVSITFTLLIHETQHSARFVCVRLLVFANRIHISLARETLLYSHLNNKWQNILAFVVVVCLMTSFAELKSYIGNRLWKVRTRMPLPFLIIFSCVTKTISRHRRLWRHSIQLAKFARFIHYYIPQLWLRAELNEDDM